MKRELICAVGIPTYNSGSYLIDAIQSLLRQEFKDFNIYISDDSVNDSVFKLVEPYLCERVNYFKNKPSLGYVGNVNKLFELKKRGYDYLAILHHDDMHFGESISTFLAIAARNPNAGLITASVLYADKDGLTDRSHKLTEKVWPKGNEAIDQCWSIFCSSTFYNLRLVDEFGLLSTDYPYSADIEHFSRIGSVSDIVTTSKTLGVSRLHGDNYRYKTWGLSDFPLNFFQMVVKIECNRGLAYPKAVQRAAKAHLPVFFAIACHLLLKRRPGAALKCLAVVGLRGISIRGLVRSVRAVYSEFKHSVRAGLKK